MFLFLIVLYLKVKFDFIATKCSIRIYNSYYSKLSNPGYKERTINFTKIIYFKSIKFA